MIQNRKNLIQESIKNYSWIIQILFLFIFDSDFNFDSNIKLVIKELRKIEIEKGKIRS